MIENNKYIQEPMIRILSKQSNDILVNNITQLR